MNQTNKTLFKLLDLFALNEKDCSTLEIMEIGMQNLLHYSKHPFKLYIGQRFADLVESIKSNGLFSPIIVRHIIDDKYEILSGHNRYEACKLAGFNTISSIVKKIYMKIKYI